MTQLLDSHGISITQVENFTQNLSLEYGTNNFSLL